MNVGSFVDNDRSTIRHYTGGRLRDLCFACVLVQGNPRQVRPLLGCLPEPNTEAVRRSFWLTRYPSATPGRQYTKKVLMKSRQLRPAGAVKLYMLGVSPIRGEDPPRHKQGGFVCLLNPCSCPMSRDWHVRSIRCRGAASS